jgi:hypothetical protein
MSQDPARSTGERQPSGRDRRQILRLRDQARARGDYRSNIPADKRRALDYADDGQFAAALMTSIEKSAAEWERDEAVRKREDLERAAARLALDPPQPCTNWMSEWERETAEQAARDRLIGTDDYQDNLFGDLPTVRRRDPILEI